jgi:hypothetical protein
VKTVTTFRLLVMAAPVLRSNFEKWWRGDCLKCGNNFMRRRVLTQQRDLPSRMRDLWWLLTA